MAQLRRHRRGVLITSARVPTTLDVEQRTKRYLITMGVRVACFLAMIWVPGYWRLLCLAGAAVLPVVAVLLANAADNRREEPSPAEGPAHPGLAAGAVVPGRVADR